MVKKKQKWTREECRIRYVEGEKIGQRALAEQSGRVANLIGKWCSEDGWVKQREQYQSRLRAETQDKTIEKTSEILSDELSKINEEHIKGLEFYRKLALQCTQTLATELTALEKNGRFKLTKDKDFALVLQKYAGVHMDAINIERMALGMQYLDLNKAIEATKKAGYDVVEPED